MNYQGVMSPLALLAYFYSLSPLGGAWVDCAYKSREERYDVFLTFYERIFKIKLCNSGLTSFVE